ncbi:MAG: hypothetical protein CL823_01885 [Crocinitomicaceae bacterium]|nr:hypothetical protein [Crocinitomicaceae bacterium]
MMNRKHLSYLILLPFLLSSCVDKVESPNFIFILVDDQGWNGTSVQMMNSDTLSKSDYHETPNLEKLASSGIKFSNAYSAAPVCAPSRYSIQFAKSPARLSLIRVGMNSDHIDHEGMMSIPKALKEINSDYVTAHYGKWGIGSSPELVGYDFSDGPNQNRDGGFVNNKTQWNCEVKEDPKNIFSLTENAINFITENSKNPFYLQISHYAVHSNIQAREQSLNKYELKKKGSQQINPGFAAMTEDLDKGLGLIIEKVKELGLDDNTYIIYMADNGSVPNIPGAKKYDFSYNFPLQRGKWDAMEGGVRVPLIISGPNVEKGIESAVPVSGSDILPTLIDLAGSSNVELHEIDGGSFCEVLKGDETHEVERDVEGLFFHVPYRNGIALNRPHSAVRKGDFKLIKFHDNNELQLYNLEEDISESINLSKSNTVKADELENILDEYLKDVHAPRWQEGITWKSTPIDLINSFY